MRKTKFVVTKDHLKLLKRMVVDYDECSEFGAPIIDPKRPYGNSDVYGDIAEILEIESRAEDGDDPYFSEDDESCMAQFHRETATVLQIALATGKFKAGTYECEEYNYNGWKLVK